MSRKARLTINEYKFYNLHRHNTARKIECAKLMPPKLQVMFWKKKKPESPSPIYLFRPLPDITAYELARLLRLLHQHPRSKSLQKMFDELPPEFLRHIVKDGKPLWPTAAAPSPESLSGNAEIADAHPRREALAALRATRRKLIRVRRTLRRERRRLGRVSRMLGRK